MWKALAPFLIVRDEAQLQRRESRLGPGGSRSFLTLRGEAQLQRTVANPRILRALSSSSAVRPNCSGVYPVVELVDQIAFLILRGEAQLQAVSHVSSIVVLMEHHSENGLDLGTVVGRFEAHGWTDTGMCGVFAAQFQSPPTSPVSVVATVWHDNEVTWDRETLVVGVDTGRRCLTHQDPDDPTDREAWAYWKTGWDAAVATLAAFTPVVATGPVAVR